MAKSVMGAIGEWGSLGCLNHPQMSVVRDWSLSTIFDQNLCKSALDKELHKNYTGVLYFYAHRRI